MKKIKIHKKTFQTGIGPGGSVQCLKFDTENSNRVYSCSIDGTFAAKDFGGKNVKKYFKIPNSVFNMTLELSPYVTNA